MRIMFATTVMALGLGAYPALAGDAGKPHLDGKWLIVYAEEGSRRNNAWEQRLATVKDNKLSYEAEGKQRALELVFGPNQSLTAKVSDGDKTTAHKGVYIAAQDYLCISLVTGAGKAKTGSTGATGAVAADRPTATAAQPDGEHRSSGDFILILRRQRAK